MALDPGDDHRRCGRRSGARADPRDPACVLLDQRDHHVVDAQLRRRARDQLPDLRLRVVLARHVEPDGEGVPAGEEPARGGELARLARRLARAAVRIPPRRRDRGRHLAALHTHALRFRGAGDRRLAARSAVCGHAHPAEDPRGDGPLRRRRGNRRRVAGRRLPPLARSARADRRGLRLRGDRDRGARTLQPVRRRPDRISARWAPERRLHPAGRRLPVRPRRRHAGPDPLRRPRWRAARPLPRPFHVTHTRRGGHSVILAAGSVNTSVVVVVLASAVVYGTTLLYAALGELLAERSGVLNLGVEGMMLTGAVTGFWAVQRTASLPLAILVAALAGAAMSAVLAFLVVTLRANQIVSALALTIFAGAAGLSSYLGNDLELADSPARHSFQPFLPHSWQTADVVGPIFFKQSVLVYASWVCVLLVALYLNRTRPGLNVRAVGESPAAADAMGINVAAYRYAHTIVGGALAGVGGACFSLAITPQWTDGLTQGAGWIAIALVIFAFWRPDLCLVGASLFGAFSALPFTFQARGILKQIPPELFQSLPYVMTVVVLVFVSTGLAKRRLGAPAALGRPYVREER